MTSPTDATKWSIDTSTGHPILTYEGCSVIQDEQAHHALRVLTGQPECNDAEVRRAFTELGINCQNTAMHAAVETIKSSHAELQRLLESGDGAPRWAYLERSWRKRYQDRAEASEAREKRLRETLEWKPIETAPRDGTPILGWCVHAADPYTENEGETLTTYGAHCEGLSRVADGPHAVVWGGEYHDGDFETGYFTIPAWWFLFDSDFEVVANPTHWMPINEPAHKTLEEA